MVIVVFAPSLRLPNPTAEVEACVHPSRSQGKDPLGHPAERRRGAARGGAWHALPDTTRICNPVFAPRTAPQPVSEQPIAAPRCHAAALPRCRAATLPRCRAATPSHATPPRAPSLVAENPVRSRACYAKWLFRLYLNLSLPPLFHTHGPTGLTNPYASAARGGAAPLASSPLGARDEG